MKLSDYANHMGVTDKTAWQWRKAGQREAYHLPTGTIIVWEPQTASASAAYSARMPSVDQQEDADALCQLQRLRDDAAARGYRVEAGVLELAAGLHDERPNLKTLLTEQR